jgi:hypothetical protein
LISFQSPERLNDSVKAFPISGGAANPAIDDEVFGTLCHLGVEIVHQHPQRSFG